MKTYFKGTKPILPGAAWKVAFLLSAALVGNANTAIARGDGEGNDSFKRQAQSLDSAVYPPDSRPFGHSYEHWCIAWWYWALSIPAERNPILDENGSNAGVRQFGPVWFLAGSTGKSLVRNITIPRGKSLFIPIINVVNDWPCPDPNFKPAPGQSMEDFLTEGAADYIDPVTGLLLQVDGVAVADLTQFRVVTDLFWFIGSASLSSVFDPCITGRLQVGVSDGYWVMLKPLQPGQHAVRFTGTFGSGDRVDIRYRINVLP